MVLTFKRFATPSKNYFLQLLDDEVLVAFFYWAKIISFRKIIWAGYWQSLKCFLKWFWTKFWVQPVLLATVSYTLFAVRNMCKLFWSVLRTDTYFKCVVVIEFVFKCKCYSCDTSDSTAFMGESTKTICHLPLHTIQYRDWSGPTKRWGMSICCILYVPSESVLFYS